MEARSNTELLTGPKKRRKPVKVAKPVVFDEKAREEFLTGFRKRNLEKKKAKKEKQEKLMKEAKSQKRREKRQRIKEAMDGIVESIEAEDKAVLSLGLEEATTTLIRGEDTVTAIVTEPFEL